MDVPQQLNIEWVNAWAGRYPQAFDEEMAGYADAELFVVVAILRLLAHPL